MTKEQLHGKMIEIDGAKMHYLEEGSGDPILLLHNMPASSYTWRHIIPHLAKLGHCIAPDLIGMGQSDKPNIDYTIFNHIHFIEKFIEKLNLKNICIIMHGWSSVIGFDYAMRHEDKCKGLVFYEGFLHSKNGDDLSLPFQEQIHSLLSQKNIKDLVIDSPYLVDKMLSQSMLQPLSKQDMDLYRKPYLKKGSGKVLYQYLRELPLGDGTSKVDKLISDYSKKLIRSSLPKLLLYSVPGFITTVATVVWAKEHFQHLEIAEVGEDLHYSMESNPSLFVQTISVWLQSIEQQIMKSKA